LARAHSAHQDARSTVFNGQLRAVIDLPADTMPAGVTPLQLSAMLGSVKEMRLLIASGVDVNEMAGARTTALM